MGDSRTVAVAGTGTAVADRVAAALRPDPGVGRLVALDEHAIAAPDLKARLQGVDALVIALPVQSPAFAAASVRRLLDAASAAAVQHVVHVSSATVYGAWATNPVPLPDDAPLRPNPGFAFAAEHAEAERLLAEWRDGNVGSTAAVLRPAPVVGPATRTPLGRAIAGFGGVAAAGVSRPRQFLHEDDLVEAVVVALRRRIDGARNVAPEGWVPDDTARALAGGASRIRLPERLARSLAAVARAAAGGPAWPGLDPYLAHPWVVAADALRDEGWTASHSNEEAFVESQPASVWEVNPRRRQELALGATVAAAGGLMGAIGLVVRRRRRR